MKELIIVKVKRLARKCESFAGTQILLDLEHFVGSLFSVAAGATQ